MLWDFRRIIFIALTVSVFISPLSVYREYVEPASSQPTIVADQAQLSAGLWSCDLSRVVAQQDVYTATAYCLQGETFTGSRAGIGTIGVDPECIPLGSRLYITGYGFGIASDIGGLIEGRIIDVWLPSHQECITWGRKNVTVYVLKEGVSEQEFLSCLANK